MAGLQPSGRRSSRNAPESVRHRPDRQLRGWWRYHHLFADLLRARLQQEQPGRTAQLHHNAATWCEEHGLTDDAIGHAVAAGEMLWAARLIEQHFDVVSSFRGEAATIPRWLSVLPADVIKSRPRKDLCRVPGRHVPAHGSETKTNGGWRMADGHGLHQILMTRTPGMAS
jgi:hypothetical protein